MTSIAMQVTPRRARAEILGAIKSANANAPAPQEDRYVEGVIKQISAGNFKAIDHLVAVGFNLIQRRASLESVEEPAHRYVALMRARYAECYGEVDVVGATLGSCVLAERLAHAERERALALFVDERSYHRANQLLEATAVYERRNRQFVDFVRQKAVETGGPRLVCRHAD